MNSVLVARLHKTEAASSNVNGEPTRLTYVKYCRDELIPRIITMSTSAAHVVQRHK